MKHSKWQEKNRRNLTITAVVIFGLAILITIPISITKILFKQELTRSQQELDKLAKQAQSLNHNDKQLATLRAQNKANTPKQLFQDYKQLQTHLQKLTKLKLKANFSFSKDKTLIKKGYYLEGQISLTGTEPQARHFIYNMLLSPNTYQLNRIQMKALENGQITTQLQAIFCLKENQ